MQRIAWTEPLTIRERISVKVMSKRYDIRRFRDDGFWRRVAFKLPDRLALWCFIRVMGKAWVATNKGPDDITYSEDYKIWEGRSS